VTFTDLLQKATKALQDRGIPFAVGGILVASVYRKEKRAMNNLALLVNAAPKDISFLTDIFPGELSETLLPDSAVIHGVKAVRSLATVKNVLVINVDSKVNLGLEIVFSTFPWFKEAFERAQYNRIDFGFGSIPSLTVEDVIIAKLYSSTVAEDRYLDRDDVQNILQAKHELDLAYLTKQINKFSLEFPKSLWEDASEGLRRIGRSTGAKKGKLLLEG